MSFTLKRFWPSYARNKHSGSLSMKWRGQMQFYFICIIDFRGSFSPGLGYFNNLLTVHQSCMVYMRVYFVLIIFQTTVSIQGRWHHHLWNFSFSSGIWSKETPIWEQLCYLVSMEEFLYKTRSSSCVISCDITDVGLTDCRVLYPVRVISSVQLHHWWQSDCQPELKCKLEKEF